MARTEGPLEVRHEYNVFSTDGRCVAACGGWSSTLQGGQKQHEEKAANARLFASAPELLSALEEIQAEARSSLPVDGMYANKLQFYEAKVRRIAVLATRALDELEETHE